jgi:hypothetical protein
VGGHDDAVNAEKQQSIDTVVTFRLVRWPTPWPADLAYFTKDKMHEARGQECSHASLILFTIRAIERTSLCAWTSGCNYSLAAVWVWLLSESRQAFGFHT